jgi:hypothetical protein
MPGPVSDSYDPEWGTSAAAAEISDAIDTLYDRVSGVLGGRAPVDIRKLASQVDELTTPIAATLSEWEWRIIRFALERANESI